MDLRTHSQIRIGGIWTKTDHEFLVSQLGQIDKLAQSVFSARAFVRAVKAEPQAKKESAKA